MKDVSLTDSPFAENPRNVKSNIDEEIAFHLSMACEEAKEKGLDNGEAKRWAVERFGDVEKIRLVCLALAWKERWMEKFFSPAAVIIMFLLCCVTMAVLFFTAHARNRMALQAREMAVVAERNAVLARENEKRARAATEVLVDVFQDIDPSTNKNARSIEVSEILKRAATQIETEFKDHPEVIDKLRSIIANARTEMKHASESIEESIE